MFQQIEVPKKGESLKASWGASVANGINALMPMAVANGLVREGFGNGTETLPKNLRERHSASVVDRSCFRFGTVEAEITVGGQTETETHTALVSCYYNVGGITKRLADTDVSEILPDPETESETVSYLCFKLTGTTPSIVLIEEDNLEDEQKDATAFVRPLYRYEGGTLTDDLRNAQAIQMFEGGLS